VPRELVVGEPAPCHRTEDGLKAAEVIHVALVEREGTFVQIAEQMYYRGLM